MLRSEQIKALEALRKKATPRTLGAVWRSDRRKLFIVADGTVIGEIHAENAQHVEFEATADAMCDGYNALPDLLATLKAQAEAIARMLAVVDAVQREEKAFREQNVARNTLQHGPTHPEYADAMKRFAVAGAAFSEARSDLEFALAALAPAKEAEARPATGEEWRAKIREASGAAWDKIADPDAYIREMRGMEATKGTESVVQEIRPKEDRCA